MLRGTLGGDCGSRSIALDNQRFAKAAGIHAGAVVVEAAMSGEHLGLRETQVNRNCILKNNLDFARPRCAWLRVRNLHVNRIGVEIWISIHY